MGLWWVLEICAPNYRPPPLTTFVPVTRESSPGAQELVEGAQKQASPTSAGRQGATLPIPQSLGQGGLATTQPKGHCSYQGYTPLRPVSQPPMLQKEPGSISAPQAARGPQRVHGRCKMGPGPKGEPVVLPRV